ncbi:hypothetical protein [Yersinia rohdei]|uniref:hypothetical protein n=1 Tax=Yersinia rohdei TaxID=29485 RepID=UPI0011A57A80|nr:hypothetical protein [Yersinia rohdei]
MLNTKITRGLLGYVLTKITRGLLGYVLTNIRIVFIAGQPNITFTRTKSSTSKTYITPGDNTPTNGQ